MNHNDTDEYILDAKNGVKFPNPAKNRVSQKSPTVFATLCNFPMVF